jgi:hypothetical protein
MFPVPSMAVTEPVSTEPVSPASRISPRCAAPSGDGDPAPGKDPAALAGFFVTFMNGLRVAAKTNPHERTLIQRPEAAPTVLD